MQFGEKPQEEE
jgi:hypothetical protein